MSKSKVTAEERAEVAKACAEGRISQIAAAKKLNGFHWTVSFHCFAPSSLMKFYAVPIGKTNVRFMKL